MTNIPHGLIVSCQAAPGSAMDSPAVMAAFARCAEEAGAVGIRANHGPNIAAIRAAVKLPIIGIKKRDIPGFEVYITPEFRDAEEARNAGADIIAVDATDRLRPVPFADMVKHIHDQLGALVMADCSTFEEAVAAAKAGADVVATTMSGYTKRTSSLHDSGPDLRMIQEFVEWGAHPPIICEGRVHHPREVALALEAGAHAVVVGTAITAPLWITQQFVKAVP